MSSYKGSKIIFCIRISSPIDYINSEGDVITTTTTIDTGPSLALAVKALLYNLREKDLGMVRGFVRTMRLNRVGNLTILHPYAGSSILETAYVSVDLLPSGTRASLGCGGTNALHISNDTISSMFRSIIAQPV